MRLSPADWFKLGALALLLLLPIGWATWSLFRGVQASHEASVRVELRARAEQLASVIAHQPSDTDIPDQQRQSAKDSGILIEVLSGPLADGSDLSGDGHIFATAALPDGRFVRLRRAKVGLRSVLPSATTPGLILATSIAVLAMLAAATVLAFLRRRVFRRLVHGVRDLSAGNLSADVRIDGSDDIAKLAGSVDAVRQRLVEQVKTIDQQRHTLDSLVRQLREGLIVLREDNRVRLINPAAVRLLQAPDPPEEYVGRPVHRCLSPAAMRELALFPGEADADSPKQRRIRIEAPEGERTLLADIWSVDLPEGNQVPRARVLVLTDITRLEQAMKVRADFVANASHELRTPLSTIRAAVETLLTVNLRDESEQATRFLQTIERHTSRLEELVTDLLDLSRLESSAARFEPEPLQILGEVDALRARHAARLLESSLDWETQFEPGEDREVTANGHLLRLVLDNLVDNAIKFTPPGGTITIGVAHANDAVCFRICDTGVGIAADQQPRVFERFYQVGQDRSGPARGTGLGLSIVRHAVSVMGGRVSLESAPQRGTTVSVTIPRNVAHDV